MSSLQFRYMICLFFLCHFSICVLHLCHSPPVRASAKKAQFNCESFQSSFNLYCHWSHSLSLPHHLFPIILHPFACFCVEVNCYTLLYIYSVCYWCASILIKLALIFFATSSIPLLCDKNSNDAIINFKISPFSSSGELNKENFIFSFPFIFFHICPSSHLCYQLARASTKKNCQASKHPSTSIPVEVVPYLYHIVYFKLFSIHLLFHLGKSIICYVVI